MISRRFGTFGVDWTPLSENFLYTRKVLVPRGTFEPPQGQNDFVLVCRLYHLAQGVCVGVLRRKKDLSEPNVLRNLMPNLARSSISAKIPDL